jgi:HemY protein
MTRTALKTAQQAVKANPTSGEAIRMAATLLREEGKTRKAERLVEDAWRTEPDALLSEIYRDLAPTGTTALGQVKRVEKLHGLQPDHPESHVALAIASLDAQLWGEARQHLNNVLDANPSPRVCRLVARLEEGEHGNLEAARSWLARAAGDEPDGEPLAEEEDGLVMSDDVLAPPVEIRKPEPA